MLIRLSLSSLSSHLGWRGRKDRAGRLSTLSDAYQQACRDRPLDIARAWFRCFQSIVEGGFVLTDFKIDQFAFDGDSLCGIVLVSLELRFDFTQARTSFSSTARRRTPVYWSTFCGTATRRTIQS